MDQNLLRILGILELYNQRQVTNTNTLDSIEYDEMVKKLYELTLVSNYTIIHKEEHDDLEKTYQNIISPTRTSLRYHYHDVDELGNHISISSNISLNDSSFISNQLINMYAIFRDWIYNIRDIGEEPEPLSEEIFNTFTEVPYNDLKNHTKIDIHNNCSICLSGFINDENDENDENPKALIIPCGHYFHKNCIKEWLTKCHYKCPICKRSCDLTRDEKN